MMKKKILFAVCGICGTLLIVSMIVAAVPVVKTYNESRNLLILYTESDITAALESTGIPHSAVQTESGVWEIRSRHELIPMLHELMKDKGDADPVYKSAQGDMFTVIVGIWGIFTAVCIVLGLLLRNRTGKIIAYSCAFLASIACPAVLMEVVCRVPEMLF